MTVQFAPAAISADRSFSLMDQMRRISGMTSIDYKNTANLCARSIHIGLFFDGTNNNKKRDQEDVLEKTKDPNQCSHSNVVVLYDAFKDQPDDGCFSFYIPGVGTAFPEIGEKNESPDGKSKASGGDARINWALIQLLNAMQRSITMTPLIDNAQAGKLATTAPLHADMRIGPNMDGKRLFFTGRSQKLDVAPEGQLAKLQRALESCKPRKLHEVKVSVFDFSRGAAQARAFCHFVHHILLQKTDGGYTLAGVPFRLNFLGLFDSVASVGLADSSPFWRGLGGWANGTLDIVPSVERTVHLCAAHEIRANFPLSTARAGKDYPRNCVEKVYPGAHSDVGGGYPAGSQGKAAGARNRLLSQVPLADMYREAQLCMVPLLSIEQLKRAGATGAATAADLDTDPVSIERFNAYRAWSASVTETSVEEMLHGHMRLYWHWRLRHIGRTDALESHKHASSQDRQDVMESDGDFMQDMADALRQQRVDRHAAGAKTSMTDAQRDFLKLNAPYAHGEKPAVPPLVEQFFDLMVHDSHASFYLVGPVTTYDQQQKVLQLQARLRSSQEQLQAMRANPRHAARMAGAPSDAMLSINALGQRILDHQRHHPGELPLVTDADRGQLLELDDLMTSAAVRAITRKTRREFGGHICYRQVFDKS